MHFDRNGGSSGTDLRKMCYCTVVIACRFEPRRGRAIKGKVERYLGRWKVSVDEQKWLWWFGWILLSCCCDLWIPKKTIIIPGGWNQEVIRGIFQNRNDVLVFLTAKMRSIFTYILYLCSNAMRKTMICQYLTAIVIRIWSKYVESFQPKHSDQDLEQTNKK